MSVSDDRTTRSKEFVPEQRGGGSSPSADDRDGYEAWSDRTRIFLTPMAAPSIMGLLGFFGATIMLGSFQAGWWGGTLTELFVIVPFAFTFGGIAQLVAAFFSFRARDATAVAVHATWGSFWLAFGILFAMIAVGVVPAPALPFGSTVMPALAMWFVVLCSITMMGALSALTDNLGVAGVLWTLAAGSGLTAAGLWLPSTTIAIIGGWLFVVSAAIAWYTASAMMISETTGRTVLPLGKPLQKKANVPTEKPTRPISYPGGLPGAKVGQ